MCVDDICFLFFFNDTATTEIYTLSLHDALPIWPSAAGSAPCFLRGVRHPCARYRCADRLGAMRQDRADPDRKSTRLNSSHANISYAVFCLKKKKNASSCCQRVVGLYIGSNDTLA